jgi:ubiquitin-like-conjugating enzyme ATG3
MLTPEEFVAAGDHLVHTCPTWSWSSGEEGKRKSYLPSDKQYLVTNSVPSYRRAVDMYSDSIKESNVTSQMGGEHDDDWCAPSVSQQNFDEEEEVLVEPEEENDRKESIFRSDIATEQEKATTVVSSKVDEYEDMMDYEDDSLALDDDCVVDSSGLKRSTTDDDIILARRYDVSITYDNYWRTPRVFLFGYDEKGSPMTPEKVFEDIMQDYAQKTVTIEPHPHLSSRPQASIHPCQHSAAMKRVLEALMEDEKQVPDVNQYLFIFLKFLQSVIPTIEYDYTIGVQMK